jgi:hypothetical protein
MDTADETWTDGIDAKRDIIRHSLPELVNDIGMAMRDADLRFPAYITVRDSGHSLATIATPLDPSDEDWSRASARRRTRWRRCSPELPRLQLRLVAGGGKGGKAMPHSPALGLPLRG